MADSPPRGGVEGLASPHEALIYAMDTTRDPNRTCLNSEKLHVMGALTGAGESIEMSMAIDEVVSKLLYDDKYQGNSVSYLNPSWKSSLLSWKARATLGPAYVIIILWCIMVVGVLKLYFNIDDNKDEEPWVDMKSIPLVLISVGLMFLVVFRTQTTYAKWTTARTAWVNITVACRDLAMQCSVYMHDFDAASAMCRYLVVFVISVRFWLRSEDLCEELVRPILAHQGYQYLEERSEASALQQRIDDDDSLTFQFKRVCAPLPVLEVLRTILEHAADHGSIGPFHTMMEGNFKQMSTALATMERVLDTQIPFAYITHVRTAILLYSLAIPFFLTREIGWFTVLFVAFYCYVVMGLENLAVEIENPFGTDANDLPMDAYCCKIARDVTDILKRKQAVLSHTTRERHDRGDRD